MMEQPVEVVEINKTTRFKPESFLAVTAGISEQPRPDYPRMDFRREATSWLNLNGKWEFAFDDGGIGLSEGWQKQRHFAGQITVPFAFQSSLSGIGDPDLHDYIWYGRDFELPQDWANSGKRFLLHFGAVDYYCKLWVNGREVGEHRGGHIPFSFDVTELVKAAEPNRMVLYVEDGQSKFQPRGKQYWKRQSETCFYTRTSGIWQTVWLEAVAEFYLNRLRVQTEIDQEEVSFEIGTAGRADPNENYRLEVQISLDGQTCWQGSFEARQEGSLSFGGTLTLPQARLWSPENPDLYDLRLTLHDTQQALDIVESYFGMRKISIQNGRVLLNNQPYYLRLILDQGYFPGGLLTASSDEALRQDIELAKAFGFNGARKHQKIEDPRWLYWADRLGLLVWGEMPSAYEWSSESEPPFVEEWLGAIARDYNHPCLMAWVPFNESWGIEQIEQNPQQQAFVREVVELTRKLDPSRLVIDNDGWQHLDQTSDLLTIHDYTAWGTTLLERYATFKQTKQAEQLPLVSRKSVLLPQALYRGEPILFSEFGGISLIPPQAETQARLHGDWGYSNSADNLQFVEQYQSLIEALQKLGFSSGFCYTQLTDVEQEVNGLLTYDRHPKVDPAIIARINQVAGF